MYSRTWIITFTPMAVITFNTDITVMEDDIIEDTEIITILLSSEDPSVDVLTPMEQIMFLDNDSEFIKYNHSGLRFLRLMLAGNNPPPSMSV